MANSNGNNKIIVNLYKKDFICEKLNYNKNQGVLLVKNLESNGYYQVPIEEIHKNYNFQHKMIDK